MGFGEIIGSYLTIFYRTKLLQSTVISTIRIFQGTSSANSFSSGISNSPKKVIQFTTDAFSIISIDVFHLTSLTNEQNLYIISIAFTLFFSFLIIGFKRGFYVSLLSVVATVPFIPIGFCLGFFPSVLSMYLVGIPVILYFLGYLSNLTMNFIDYKLNHGGIKSFPKLILFILNGILFILRLFYSIVNFCVIIMFESLTKYSKWMLFMRKQLKVSDFPKTNTFLSMTNSFAIVMLALFFVIYDSPFLFIAEWIIMIVFLILLFIFLLRQTGSLKKEFTQINISSITGTESEMNEVSSSSSMHRFETTLTTKAINWYFLFAQILLIPVMKLICSASQDEKGLFLGITVFSVIFSLVAPLLFAVIFVHHTSKLKMILWRKEYRFYMDNSSSIAANLCMRVKDKYEFFPVLDIILRLFYAFFAFYNSKVAEWIPSVGCLLSMLFLFLFVLIIRPYRMTSMNIIAGGESLYLSIINIFGYLRLYKKISNETYSETMTIVMFIMMFVPLISALIVFTFIEFRKLSKVEDNQELRRNWDHNPDLILKNLDGRLDKYIYLLCGFVNLVGMTLFYSMLPPLKDFQYQGMHLFD
ncbi:hypothetical protein TRFO_15000 [Tritrichomonas foetus]|uniref:Transmembrane protein n=1 Tax=Tritrichomonas foetus TaxID=1144522 RepID=A0A1J4KTJ9_9EUKA|nr:hypothetical protein TRFO_15000 [Tritrichomonas foetus]|eukprot:OHT14591.1 hypothetical protein TRFO_15000 [Tritrichomonas foetus]